MSKTQTAIEFLEYQREVIKETVISADHVDLNNIDLCINLIKSITDASGKFDFGQAIKEMKNGKAVRRSGWNGKGMHIYLEDMFSFPIRAGLYKGTDRRYDPVICMFTAQGTHQAGWNASQADMLAEDWEVVELS